MRSTEKKAESAVVSVQSSVCFVNTMADKNSVFDFYAGFKEFNRTESQDTTLRTAKEFKNYVHPRLPSPPVPYLGVPVPIQLNSTPNYITNGHQKSTRAAASTLFGGLNLSPIKKVST